MARMMIKCEKTGKELQVGFPVPREEFDRADLGTGVYGPCPECGRMHLWRKSDVVLKD